MSEFKLNFIPTKYKCSCCGAEKTASEFYTESYTGQRTSQCKECINIKRRVQRNKAKHGKFISKEKIRGMETPDYILEDWRDSMLFFRGACAFCGKPEGRSKKEKLDRDHLRAISKGGKTVRANIIPACRRCNRGRGNKDWREWFRAQPFYTPEREVAIEEWSGDYETDD